MPFLEKKFSLLSVIIFSAVAVLVFFSITSWINKDDTTSEIANSEYYCKYDIKRLNGLK